jgi:hypothetical protein
MLPAASVAVATKSWTALSLSLVTDVQAPEALAVAVPTFVGPS